MSFEIENNTNGNEDVANFGGPTSDEVFTAFEARWYEQRPVFNSTELVLLKNIKDSAAKKKNNISCIGSKKKKNRLLF